MNDNIPTSLPTSDVLLAELDEYNVARLTMNRPERHNAFTPELIAALHEAFRAAAQMKGLRAVVLQGEGRSFSAGADLGYMKEAGSWSEAENAADGQRLSDMLNAIYTCPIPTIVVAHGAVYGGGVGLVACADLAIAVDGAQFRLSEIRLGITPATISPFVLAAIGPRHARRYFMTAEPFSASEARRINLVHRALKTRGDADRQVGEWITLLGEAAPGAVKDAKTLIMDYSGKPITDDLRTDSARRIAERRADPEGVEGLTAFLEKRDPKW